MIMPEAHKALSLYILAIESSCDDTGVAVIHQGRVISNCTHTQTVHSDYGVWFLSWQVEIIPSISSQLYSEH